MRRCDGGIATTSETLLGARRSTLIRTRFGLQCRRLHCGRSDSVRASKMCCGTRYTQHRAQQQIRRSQGRLVRGVVKRD